EDRRADGKEPDGKTADKKAAGDVAQPVSKPNSSAPTSPVPDVPLVSAEDVNFLWKSVQTLGQELASPKDIQTQYEKRGLTGGVLDALRGAVDLGPVIKPVPGRNAGVYRWRFRRSGREVPAAKQLAEAMSVATARGGGKEVVAQGSSAIPAPPKPVV